MFLLDQSKYLNHFYFASLFSFIMIFVPANRAFSIDALLWPKLKERPIRRWTVWLLRFQMGCVYILFAGLNEFSMAHDTSPLYILKTNICKQREC